MAKQTILWTALPNGFSPDGESLRVSVLMTPRLQPDESDKPSPEDPAQLSVFADFVDWPATLGQSRFLVRFGANSVAVAGNAITGPRSRDARLGLADTAVWTALFPPTTPVIGFAWRDLTKHECFRAPPLTWTSWFRSSTANWRRTRLTKCRRPRPFFPAGVDAGDKCRPAD